MAAGAAAMLALPQSACATVIFSDTFTGANNTALIGRMPSPTDVPGSTYAGNGNASTVGGITNGVPAYEADIQSNTAQLGADVGVALNTGIISAAQFTLAITFNISGDTQTQANDPHRGAALGFFSSVATGTGGAFHGFNNFTGLVVDTTGSVRLIVAGANSGLATTVGGFNPAINHTLNYNVDTATGLLSNILLDGSTVLLIAPVNTFTLARTTLAGFYNSSLGGADIANFDDFSLATIPEPSTWLAVTSAALLLCIHDFCRFRASRHRRKLVPPARRRLGP